MQKTPLLIATTNQGKFEELCFFLNDLPFTLLSLGDISPSIPVAEETTGTLEGNAMQKAIYYGNASGLLTIADDSGFFIDAQGGWPGVDSGIIASTDEERIAIVLNKMHDVMDRSAKFRTVLACFDPSLQQACVSLGEVSGTVLQEPVSGAIDYGYNSIFFLNETQKTFAEMTIAEKNSVSQRGKALVKIKYYLQRQYGPRNIVVPIGILVQEGKILMSLRNDPHRLAYHKKWEFPGGAIELGEKAIDTVIREIAEETGYEAEVVRLLQYVHVDYQPDMHYQVYLLPYLCRVTGGEARMSDAEVLDLLWFTPDAILDHELIGANSDLYRSLLSEIKTAITEFHL